MSSDDIHCRATRWFIWRAVAMACLFFGFGFYFFYDGAVGYPRANEVFFAHKAFAEMGGRIGSMGESEWKAYLDRAAMWPVVPRDGVEYALGEKGTLYPMPPGANAVVPDVMRNYTRVRNEGWFDYAWKTYSAERRFPMKPGEHPYDVAAVREQWLAGSVCMLLGLGAVLLLLRTLRRSMSLEGDQVTAAGCSFRVADIRRIDLRSWKLKGLAFFTVAMPGGNRRVRIDGMSYGGFEKSRGEPAERFMQAVLSRYEGEILHYEDALGEE